MTHSLEMWDIFFRMTLGYRIISRSRYFEAWKWNQWIQWLFCSLSVLQSSFSSFWPVWARASPWFTELFRLEGTFWDHPELNLHIRPLGLQCTELCCRALFTWLWHLAKLQSLSQTDLKTKAINIKKQKLEKLLASLLPSVSDNIHTCISL